MEAVYSFGYWVMRRRKALNLTQGGLAQRVSCSPATIKKIERDERRPSLQVAELLAVALAVAREEHALFLRVARGELPVDRLSFAFHPPPAPGQAPRHNLPLNLSSFVGRHRELDELRQLLAKSRLTSLTGAGGSGKTRLALQAVEGLTGSFSDGVWLVELASLGDPTLVASVVVSTLGILEHRDKSAEDTLIDYFRNREVLLLLDNCEHLIEGVARLVDSLLHQCPRLHVLATTREELGIVGEVVWLVPPLSLPATDEDLAIRNLAQHDAIRLFVERATDAWQAFALTEDNAAAVTYLCRQLDGMPMAIELAAARVRLLRVEQIVARLENRFQLLAGGNHTAPPRHQTLKALIDWSYGLLSPVDQRLLRRLSVFAHGFQLEAVEAICDEESEGNTLDSLTHLVTKSLVVSNRASGKTARFELHETIRQYAWLELVQADESDRILERHGAYFVQLAEELHPQLYCDSQLTSPERWLAEYGNLRAVLNRVFADKVLTLEAGLCLAARLTDFWLMEGPKSEGRYWLEKATARMSGVAPAIRAALFYNLGKLWIGRKGESLAKKSLQLFLRVEDNIGAAWALNLLGHLAKDNDQDFARCSALFTKSIEMASDQDTENKLLLANLAGLSLVNIQIGQYEPAREYVERGLVLARAANDGQQIATLLRFRGAVARMQKDYELATSSFLEVLPLAREVHAKNLVIASLNGLGEVLRDQRKFSEAIPYYTEGLAVFREWDPTRSGTMLANLGHAVVDNGEPERATAILRESLSIVEEDPRPGEVAWSLWGFSKVSLSKGQLERAVRLYGAAEGLLTSSGSTTDPLDRADAEHNKSRLRIELGEEAFSTAWAEGEQLSLEAAVAYAVEEQA